MQVTGVARAIQVEFWLWVRPLRDRELWVFLAILAIAITLLMQRPLYYQINIGQEDGLFGDLPLLRNWNGAEKSEQLDYRWTSGNSQITLAGLAQQDLELIFEQLPVDAAVLEVGPAYTDVWVGEQQLARLPIDEQPRRVHLLVSAAWLDADQLRLSLRSATFTPPGDPRKLGMRFSSLLVCSTWQVPQSPPLRPLAGWLLIAAGNWLLLRRLGFAPVSVLRFCGGAGLLLSIAAALDPPRWALGVMPALITLGLCIALSIFGLHALPVLLRHLQLPISSKSLRWLLLAALASFALRYAGRLYPDSMPGDIGFHLNRFVDTLGLGRVLLLSRNRGVDFPYPPGPYLMLAPFTLTGLSPRMLLQLLGCLAEGLNVITIYLIARVGLGNSVRAQRTALIAAGLGGLMAGGFMTVWWNFSTHIFSQYFWTLTVAAAVINGPRLRMLRMPAWVWFLLGNCLLVVFLSHFGFMLNSVLLGSLLLLVLGLSAWRRRIEWRVFWRVLLIYLGAGSLALALFYAQYVPLFLDQAQATASSGLTGLTQREAISRAVLWEGLWRDGIHRHFGLFPALLAPLGLLLLHRWKASTGLIAIIGAGFVVGLCFAGLPFLTGSTLSTRWLMFNLWAVALCAAPVWEALWRRGRAGRLLVLGMAAYVAWNTAVLWLGALAWRIRPPEPF